MKKLICYLIIIFVSIDNYSQDSISNNTVLCFVPTDFLNRTFSLSVYRQVKKSAELSFHAEYRIGNKKEPDEAHNVIDNHLFISIHHLVKDPYWYYNRVTTQAGILYHFGNFIIEPMALYEYGYFKNQTLIMTDNLDLDTYEISRRSDRRYHAGGCILNFGYCRDYDRFRLKVFIGCADMVRFYRENIP